MSIIDRSNWLGSLIRRTSLCLTNIFDQKMATYQITSSNYWILKLLWKGDGLTQKQLVEALGVKPASLTGMIDSMEKTNYNGFRDIDVWYSYFER